MSRVDSRFFLETAKGTAPYAQLVLGQLQGRRGEPNLRTRLLAALVVVGLVVLTAPLVVLPIMHWLARVL